LPKKAYMHDALGGVAVKLF